MSDGFRNVPPRSSVIVQGFNLGSFQNVPLNSFTENVTNFSGLEITMVGIGTAGGTLGLLQAQLLWYDVDIRLVWVDTVEFPFETVGGFLGKQAYIRTPVRGAILQIVTNGGTNPPANPQVMVNVYGLPDPVDKLICWNDQANSQGTDLVAVGQSGGAIASGGSVGPFFSGLHSGGVMVQLSVAWTTGAATAGQARLRIGFGSTTFGYGDLYVNQPTVAYALAVPAFFVGYMPRRPLVCVVADTAGGVHNTINSWQFTIVRDEP